jgi:hypothetical protein
MISSGAQISIITAIAFMSDGTLIHLESTRAVSMCTVICESGSVMELPMRAKGNAVLNQMSFQLLSR